MRKEPFEKRDKEEALPRFKKGEKGGDGNEVNFTPEQLAEIENKRQILSSLAYFIGKDFEIPVELNNSGAGWHWDFKNNVIRIDPEDLIEKPMDYLRFVISHEAGHRRITRADFIPPEEWEQLGFSFMMNVVEDPRDNNFVAESYQKFREQMRLFYDRELDFENKKRETANKKLGQTPRFVRAGLELIKQWHREVQGQPFEISADLPEDVNDVIKKTLKSAQDSWWRYPSRKEADDGKRGEKNITAYAKLSYQINRDEIWPEFKKLIEKDMEDQKVQEALKGMRQEKQQGGQISQDLKDRLTLEEQKELDKALQDPIKKSLKGSKEQAGQKQSEQDKDGKEQDSEQQEAGQKPIDTSNLTEGLKRKIGEYIDSLPKEEQDDLRKKAQEALKDFEKTINEDLQGKLCQKLEEVSESEKTTESAEKTPEIEAWSKSERVREQELKEFRQKIESLFEKGKKDPYQEVLIETSELINALTADLRDIFTKRKIEKYETGYRSGRRWNIRQRVREKVAGIPLFKTEAREQKEAQSEEMDYAITLLVDLSGSMVDGNKIEETFKSTVVLAETLNNLGINFEIVGFQDILLEFKSFQEHLDEPMQNKLNGMILEVNGSNPDGHNNPLDNDDGVALLEASKHLMEQTAKNKFLIVLSDGLPETRYKSRDQLSRELKEAITEVTMNTNQKLIGIGLMSDKVKDYYENNIAGVSTEEMVETFGGLLREIIEKY
jgi:cobalamin biosynthesis protein CobT